jgi:hypothetical protein
MPIAVRPDPHLWGRRRCGPAVVRRRGWRDRGVDCPNGAGKTTTLRTLAGSQADGRLGRIDGFDIGADAAAAIEAKGARSCPTNPTCSSI